MFRSRLDHISDLIDLHQRFESSNINSLLENPMAISQDIEKIRDFLKTEIESFSIFVIDGLLDLRGTIDIKFAEKIIDFNPQFFGEVLAKAVTERYSKLGFDSFLKIICQIKNLTSALDGIEVLFNKIIFDGEKHRNEACELNKKLEEINSSEDFNGLSCEQQSRVTNMIERLKPHARPIIKKNFYYEGMPLKEGEENGSSYPIFSRSGNWAEHHLVMSCIANSFKEKQEKYKKPLLKK